MSKIAIVYWSGTGNTEQMAQYIADGAAAAGGEVTLYTAQEFHRDLMQNYDALAFGCPSMGAEVLEEEEFAPMFSSCEPALQNRKIALFGSYGWGDGEWMRNWETDCRKAEAILVCKPVICNEFPDSQAEAACKEMGKVLA